MLFLSKSRGTKGRIKSTPEDFIVKEILASGMVLEPSKPYSAAELGEQEGTATPCTRFVLQKRNWDTVRALLTIAKILGRGRKSIGYSGAKDKVSVSTQLASLYGVTPERVMSLKFNEMWINGAWAGEPVELGSNLGNEFEITLRETENPEQAEKIIGELGGVFPNYFDRQRFGYRMNNFKVGMHILRGEFKEAIMCFLTDPGSEDDEETRFARKKLMEEQEFKAALEYFPKRMGYERTVIEYMSRYDNPANALRKLPRGISLLFVHSVESGIFNAELELRMRSGDLETERRCQRDAYGFPNLDLISSEPSDFAVAPLVGYETPPERISSYAKSALEKIGVTQDQFKIKTMPELSMKGAYRVLMAPAKEMSCRLDEKTVKLDFKIPSGSYATVLVNEISKSDDFQLSSISSQFDGLLS